MMGISMVRAACLLAGGLLAFPALGAGLRVTPLRLDLSAQQSATQIELTNLGAAALPVQVSAFGWTQQDGRDVYAPTKDLFFAPPIVSVPAGGNSIVRFRLRGAAPQGVERAYRVYFQEIAPPQSAGTAGMAFRLKLGVPVFVAPAKPVAPRLELQHQSARDRLELTLANAGTAHLKIHGLEVFAATVDRARPDGVVAKATHSEQGANYLLPGSRHRWTLALPPGADPARHVLLVRTDDYSGKAASGMTPAGWLWVPLSPTPAGTEPRR